MGRMKEYYYDVLTQFEDSDEQEEFLQWIDKNELELNGKKETDQHYVNWLNEKEVELQDKEFLEQIELDREIAETMATTEVYRRKA